MSKAKKPSIDDHISALNISKLPSRDLWKGIDYAITEMANDVANDASVESGIVSDLDSGVSALNGKPRKTRTPLYAMAASVCLVALVGYISFQTGKNTSGQELVQRISAQHTEQKKALLSSFEGQPTVTQNWQQQLAELDEAAVAIKKALENEPNNPALLRMLKRVHQQQIALIERVHAPAWQQI
jgi:hypothetical protein